MDYFGSIVNSFTPAIAAPKAQKTPSKPWFEIRRKVNLTVKKDVNLSRKFAREFYLHAIIMSLRASSGAQKRPR
jgi:hypothetical protein